MCSYMSAEFRRHRETTNKVHIIGFLSQWKVYLDALPAGPEGGKAFRGKPLDPTTLEKVRRIWRILLHDMTLIVLPCQMSAEQLGQLYEVMHVTKDVWRPVTPEQDGRAPSDSEGSTS